MFDIEIRELIFFIRQLGLALAGASALWGLVFTITKRHVNTDKSCFIYQWIAQRLSLPTFIGIALATAGWALLYFMFPVSAHEGIVISPTEEKIYNSVTTFAPIYILWIIFSLGTLIMYCRGCIIQKHFIWFYSLNLIIATFLISTSVWLGELSRQQFFFIGHSAHSIITIGTVLVLDYLFLISKTSTILKQHIFPFFPTISKVIWIGLGIDFISVALVFNEAILLTPKFFFMQTVIVILIINGTLLSGPITRRLVKSVSEDGSEIPKKWWWFASIAGTISVASWTTNTFVDSFEKLSLNYIELFSIYLGLIILLIIAHTTLEWFLKNHPPVIEQS